MLLPKQNDRALFVGPTGSGKTVLARFCLAYYQNVIVVDPKQQWVMQRNEKSPTGFSYPTDRDYSLLRGKPVYFATNLDELERAMNDQIEKPYHIVYRLPLEHGRPQNADKLDEVARLVLQRGHTTLYYDELYYVANGTNFADKAPNYFYCVTTGRSKRIGVWASVQRPTWIPIIALSETDVRSTFFLRHYDDRIRMDKVMGDGIPWNALQKFRHSFVMADDFESTNLLRLELPAENKKEVA